MAKYRKKPVVIEAFQYFDDMGTYTYEIPVWFCKACGDGMVYYDAGTNKTYIKTLEGNHEISDKDFVIQGIKGELYPCKPDIFEQTYEAVRESKNDIGMLPCD